MITENCIKLGYGTILVGVSFLPPAITFGTTCSAHTVGSTVEDDCTKTGDTISIAINIQRFAELERKLLQVENRECDAFEFCGYQFDFFNYNPKSVQVIREKANKAWEEYLLTAVC